MSVPHLEIALREDSNAFCWVRRAPNGILEVLERWQDPTQHRKAAGGHTGLIVFVAAARALNQAAASCAA